jgi:hypothetical protein
VAALTILVVSIGMIASCTSTSPAQNARAPNSWPMSFVGYVFIH